MAFYCSKDCQKADWKNHKIECSCLAEQKERLSAAADDDASPIERCTGTTKGSSVGPCGICFKDSILHPIVFDSCNHAFCCTCLIQFQGSNALPTDMVPTTKCPCCGTEVVVDFMTAKISAITARVGRGGLPEEERDPFATVALDNSRKLYDVGNAQMKLTFTYCRAVLLDFRDDHHAALKVSQDAVPELTELASKRAKLLRLASMCSELNLDFVTEAKKRDLFSTGGFLRKTDLVGLHLAVAEAQKKLEGWQAALDTYNMLLDTFPAGGDEMTFDQEGYNFRGAQECHFQMKDYDRSILLGEAIMKAVAFTPTAHKETAKAYKAIGNLDEAPKLAAKGILLETTLDAKTKMENWEFWKEINEENIDGSGASEH